MSHKRYPPLFITERQSLWITVYTHRWQRPYSGTLQSKIRQSIVSTRHGQRKVQYLRIASVLGQLCTSVKQANIPNTYIQMLDCWRNDTFQYYIKNSSQELAKVCTYLNTSQTVSPSLACSNFKQSAHAFQP